MIWNFIILGFGVFVGLLVGYYLSTSHEAELYRSGWIVGWLNGYQQAKGTDSLDDDPEYLRMLEEMHR